MTAGLLPRRLPVSQAIGRVSAELLCPYPPGVPAVYPGEVIKSEALARLDATLAGGGKVTGASDASLSTLLVISSHVVSDIIGA